VRPTAIHPGAVIEARVRGTHFRAKVIRRVGHEVEVDPIDKWATWRKLKPSQVLRVVDMQERLA
jgi:hypothetical protein